MGKSRSQELLADTKAELEDVKKAIKQIITGAQGYRAGSRSVQKADLDTLYKRRDYLENKITDLEGASRRTFRVVPLDN